MFSPRFGQPGTLPVHQPLGHVLMIVDNIPTKFGQLILFSSSKFHETALSAQAADYHLRDRGKIKFGVMSSGYGTQLRGGRYPFEFREA